MESYLFYKMSDKRFDFNSTHYLQTSYKTVPSIHSLPSGFVAQVLMCMDSGEVILCLLV